MQTKCGKTNRQNQRCDATFDGEIDEAFEHERRPASSSGSSKQSKARAQGSLNSQTSGLSRFSAARPERRARPTGGKHGVPERNLEPCGAPVTLGRQPQANVPRAVYDCPLS